MFLPGNFACFSSGCMLTFSTTCVESAWLQVGSQLMNLFSPKCPAVFDRESFGRPNFHTEFHNVQPCCIVEVSWSFDWGFPLVMAERILEATSHGRMEDPQREAPHLTGLMWQIGRLALNLPVTVGYTCWNNNVYTLQVRKELNLVPHFACLFGADHEIQSACESKTCYLG